jgi:hypothetical protein
MIQKAYQIFNNKNEASLGQLGQILFLFVLVVFVFALSIRENWSIITYSAVTFILMLLLRKTWLKPSWRIRYAYKGEVDVVFIFQLLVGILLVVHVIVMLKLRYIDPEHYPEHYPDSNHLPTAK